MWCNSRIRIKNPEQFSCSQHSVINKSCAGSSAVVLVSKSDTFEPASANKTLMHQLMWLGKNKTRDAPKHCAICWDEARCFHGVTDVGFDRSLRESRFFLQGFELLSCCVTLAEAPGTPESNMNQDIDSPLLILWRSLSQILIGLKCYWSG